MQTKFAKWLRAMGLTWAFVVTLAGVSRAHDSSRPAALRDVAFDQKLDQQIPLDLKFRDETGAVVGINRYFGRKPVILNFVYYKCRDLCPLLLDGMVRTMRLLGCPTVAELDPSWVRLAPSR